MMKASTLVKEAESRLRDRGVPEARTKLEWWVSAVIGAPRDRLDGVEADEEQARTIEEGITRLEQHEPLQYVIGHTPFLNVNLKTDSRALIPRPETEELVSLVLSCEELWEKSEVCLADVGTGSGCIAISLAANQTKARVTAIDISAEALALAQTSAHENHVSERITFEERNLLEGTAPESLDAVVSNPPYIAANVIPTLEDSVCRFEPLSALDGGPDGLGVIRTLIVQAFTTLKKGGRLWLEIGDEQGDAVADLLREAGFRDVDIKRDMYGRERFAIGKK